MEEASFHRRRRWSPCFRREASRGRSRLECPARRGTTGGAWIFRRRAVRPQTTVRPLGPRSPATRARARFASNRPRAPLRSSRGFRRAGATPRGLPRKPRSAVGPRLSTRSRSRERRTEGTREGREGRQPPGVRYRGREGAGPKPARPARRRHRRPWRRRPAAQSRARAGAAGTPKRTGGGEDESDPAPSWQVSSGFQPRLRSLLPSAPIRKESWAKSTSMRRRGRSREDERPSRESRGGSSRGARLFRGRPAIKSLLGSRVWRGEKAKSSGSFPAFPGFRSAA